MRHGRLRDRPPVGRTLLGMILSAWRRQRTKENADSLFLRQFPIFFLCPEAVSLTRCQHEDFLSSGSENVPEGSRYGDESMVHM